MYTDNPDGALLQYPLRLSMQRGNTISGSRRNPCSFHEQSLLCLNSLRSSRVLSDGCRVKITGIFSPYPALIV